MKFQDKEEVGSAGLKLEGSESMVEASLYNIPSRGHKYRGVAPLKRKGKKNQAFSKYVSYCFKPVC